MLSIFNLIVWNYLCCFVSYYRFCRLAGVTFYTQNRIYFLLPWLGPCTFSDMDGTAIFALHGYCHPALSGQDLPDT